MKKLQVLLPGVGGQTITVTEGIFIAKELRLEHMRHWWKRRRAFVNTCREIDLWEVASPWGPATEDRHLSHYDSQTNQRGPLMGQHHSWTTHRGPPPQGTINCAILGSLIGGSGDPRRKWDEMGERKVLLLFAKWSIQKNHRNARSVYIASQKTWFMEFIAIIKKVEDTL